MIRGDRYFVIDVETANADYASICQAGWVEVREGEIVDAGREPIEPWAHFDPASIRIHGITAKDVRGAQDFAEFLRSFRRRVGSGFLVHHGPFDRIAIEHATLRYGETPLDCQWVDGARIVRKVWPDFRTKGYGLASVAEALGIAFRQHDALEDALAAQAVLATILGQTGLSLQGLVARIDGLKAPAEDRYVRVRREGAADGPFAGQQIVFAGTLSMLRAEAADHAAALGFDVADIVTRSTAVLCVGALGGGGRKCSRTRRAEELADEGHPIRILSEEGFQTLVSLYR
ncbi:MAG: exonuclease domain-containing protein [Hyphomicrobiales bacterium]